MGETFTQLEIETLPDTVTVTLNKTELAMVTLSLGYSAGVAGFEFTAEGQEAALRLILSLPDIDDLAGPEDPDFASVAPDA